MSNIQIIASFVIYAGDQIVLQRGFQVSESPDSMSCLSKDGREFTFIHSYKGNECKVELSCSENDTIIADCRLAIPINRTKMKWKHTTLGMQYDVYYRCSFEDWDSKKMIKQLNKQRGRAATGRNKFNENGISPK